MSFKEVSALRKVDKLEEALEMASLDLENNPEDIWNKRSIAWVYYSYMKLNASFESYDAFFNYLVLIGKLQLPESENMLFDNLSFQISKIIFSLQRQKDIDFSKIESIWGCVKDFPFTRSSNGFSAILKAFHKGNQDWTRYIEFIEWWGLDNFRDEDFESEEYNGKSIISIVERVYIAFAKKLLQGEKVSTLNFVSEINKDKVNLFLKKLNLLINEYPEYQYPPYYKAKLLLALGGEDEVLSDFVSFAKQKQNSFWVWEMISDTVSNTDDKIGFLCKALSLKTPNYFLVKIRLKLAKLLIQKNLYSEAKTEIINVIKTRERNEWKISFEIIAWLDEKWYLDAKELQNNNEFYLDNNSIAEEYLYQNDPEDTIVIEFVNRNKKILSFIKDKSSQGFFNYSNKIENPQIGELLKVRLKKQGNDGFYHVLSVHKMKNKESNLLKKIKGKIILLPNNSFGFVNDYFVNSNLIEKHNLVDGDSIDGEAIISFRWVLKIHFFKF